MNPLILILHKLSPLLPLITSFCLIYIIQAHKLDSKARNSLLVYLGSMGCWALGSLLMRNSDSLAAIVFWGKIIWVAAAVMAAAALHFVYELLELRRRKLVYVFYGISSLVAVIALATGWVVSGLQVNRWGYFAEAGPLRYHISAFFAAAAFYSFILLFKHRYSKDGSTYREANIMLIALIIDFLGGFVELLPTVGVPIYPPVMITHTIFVILIAYGAFKYQLVGVLGRAQPRIVLASLTYALIATGMALAFTDSGSNVLFTFLLGFLFLAFNSYHFFDDIRYLAEKYLKIRRRPFLYKGGKDSSVLFDNKEIGILAINPRKEILFSNTRAAKILGADVIESGSVAALQNDVFRRKLEKYSKHRRETVISLDEKTYAELTPIELGSEYVGTLVCFYPKSKPGFSEKAQRTSRYLRLNLWDVFFKDY